MPHGRHGGDGTRGGLAPPGGRRGAMGPCWNSAPCARPSARWSPSTAPRCRPARGASSASWAPTGRARPPPCAPCSAWSPSTAARWPGRGGPVGRAERLRFGYMPEQRGLYPRMRIGEQLTWLGRIHGMTAAAARRAAAAWLERLGLADRAGHRLEQLSHGNQQRVQLAAALLHDPEALVLDEPFAGLDPMAAEALAEIIRERAAAGVTVLFSSHQLDLVQDVCDDVAIIDRGRVVLAGSLEEVRRRAPHRRLDLALAGDAGWSPSLARHRAAGTAPRAEHLPGAGGRRPGRPPRRRRPGRPGHPLQLPAPHPVRPLPRGGGPMSAGRDVYLVALREVRERARSRAFIVSTAFTLLLVIGALAAARPSSPSQPPPAYHIGVVGQRPAGLDGALGLAAAASGALVSTEPLADRAAAEAALEEERIDAALLADGTILVERRGGTDLESLLTFALRQAGFVRAPGRGRDRPRRGGGPAAARRPRPGRGPRRRRRRRRRRPGGGHRRGGGALRGHLLVRAVGAHRGARGEGEPGGGAGGGRRCRCGACWRARWSASACSAWPSWSCSSASASAPGCPSTCSTCPAPRWPPRSGPWCGSCWATPSTR